MKVCWRCELPSIIPILKLKHKRNKGKGRKWNQEHDQLLGKPVLPQARKDPIKNFKDKYIRETKRTVGTIMNLPGPRQKHELQASSYQVTIYRVNHNDCTCESSSEAEIPTLWCTNVTESFFFSERLLVDLEEYAVLLGIIQRSCHRACRKNKDIYRTTNNYRE